MKKLISFVLVLILGFLLYIGYKQNQQFNERISIPEDTQINDTTLQSTTESTTISETSTTTLKEDSLFGEKLVNESSYPIATIPPKLEGLTAELYDAINTVYIENYSQEQKEINTHKLSNKDLEELQNFINDDTLSPLNIQVDQITMVLDSTQVYIPRIIVPITYENAERLIKDNDVSILTQAMTHLGNRLIMIAYYDPQSKVLTAYHLTNWTLPLFTYPNE